MVAFAGYPLIVDDRVVGVLALFSREALSQTAFQALEAIANAVAVGIEHRMSQAERGALARQVSLLLESTAEGVCGVDLQGCVTFINRSGAQTLGYQPEEMLGQPMHLLAHHHHADGSVYPAEDCPVYQTVKSGQSVRVDDDVFWRRDGTSFPVEYACAAIREDGQIRGAVYTFADITARKRAEAALLQTKVRAEEAQAEAERANLSQERVPLAHEPRAAHAPQRHPRLRPTAGDGRPKRPAARKASRTSSKAANTCSASSTRCSTSLASRAARWN